MVWDFFFVFALFNIKYDFEGNMPVNCPNFTKMNGKDKHVVVNMVIRYWCEFTPALHGGSVKIHFNVLPNTDHPSSFKNCCAKFRPYRKCKWLLAGERLWQSDKLGLVPVMAYMSVLYCCSGLNVTKPDTWAEMTHRHNAQWSFITVCICFLLMGGFFH